MRSKSKVPQIIAMIQEGHTAREIMDALGCTRMNVHLTAKRYGLDLKLADRHKYSDEEKEAIKSLKRSGLSNAEIAKQLNCSVNSIKRVTTGLGQVYRNQYSIKSFDSESHARDMINNYLRSRDIEYCGNYTGCDNPVDLRCRKCGTVFTRSMGAVRNNRIHCPECAKRANEDIAKKREAERIAKLEQLKQKAKEKEKAKQLRELAKLIKIKAKEHPCLVCGCITTNKKYCSRKCANKVKHKNKELIRDRRIKAQIIDKDISLVKLYKRDNGICYICGLKCNYDDYIMRGKVFIAGDYYPSIEHIKPLSKGGNHSWDNIKLAHRKCNTFKGVRELVV